MELLQCEILNCATNLGHFGAVQSKLPCAWRRNLVAIHVDWRHLVAIHGYFKTCISTGPTLHPSLKKNIEQKSFIRPNYFSLLSRASIASSFKYCSNCQCTFIGRIGPVMVSNKTVHKTANLKASTARLCGLKNLTGGLPRRPGRPWPPAGPGSSGNLQHWHADYNATDKSDK